MSPLQKNKTSHSLDIHHMVRFQNFHHSLFFYYLNTSCAMGHLCKFVGQAWLGCLDIRVSEGSAMEPLECLDSIFAVCDHLKGTQCVKV